MFRQYSTTFIPDQDGDWEIGLNVAGRGNLFIDDELVIELSHNPARGKGFFGLGTLDARALICNLKAGNKYKVEIRLNNAEFISRGVPFACRGGVRLGVVHHIDADEGIKAAAALAKESDGEDISNAHHS